MLHIDRVHRGVEGPKEEDMLTNCQLCIKSLNESDLLRCVQLLGVRLWEINAEQAPTVCINEKTSTYPVYQKSSVKHNINWMCERTTVFHYNS